MSVWNQGEPASQGVTERYESLHALNPKQARVLQELVSGASHGKAAETVGVHRVTVSRWANHHPEFIAEMNRARADAVADVRLAIARITTVALDAVLAAVSDGDTEAAFRWLRLLGPGNLVPPEPGPLEADDVIEDVRRSLPTFADKVLLDDASLAEAKAAIRSRLDS